MFTGIAGFLLFDIARNIATRYRQPGGIFEGGIARCHSQEHSGQPAGASAVMEAGYVFWCLTGMKKSKLPL